jgi:aspartate aminotransferase-like enzyme
MVNKNFNDKGIDYLLFTPGPVNVPDWVLAEMAKGNDTHRSTAYRQMHKAVRDKLQKLLHTKNEIFLWANSATGIMEACVLNLIGENDIGLFLSCGDFGDRWAKMAKACGRKYEVVNVNPGKGISVKLVQESLSKGNYSVVFITMNETSTGIMNPVDQIAPIVKKHGALLCVDCVSCMAGVNIDVDKWGIDIALASVQKCFGVPPGLSVCSISKAALDKASTVKNRGVYLDFISMLKSSEKDEHPVTPPIPQIRALNKVLDRLMQITPEVHYQAQAERTKMIQEWVNSIGLKVFGEEGFISKTVVTVENTLNLDIPKLVAGLLDKGYKIVNGYGVLENKTFRIAAMGWITKEQTAEMLKAATEIIQTMIKK